MNSYHLGTFLSLHLLRFRLTYSHFFSATVQITRTKFLGLFKGAYIHSMKAEMKNLWDTVIYEKGYSTMA